MVNNTQAANSSTSNRAATGYMLGAVTLFSMLPLILSFGNARQAPALFSSTMNICGAIVCAIFLATRYSEIIFKRQTLRIIFANCRNKEMFWAVGGCFNYAIFAWSLKYIDIAVVTILFQTWPLMMILITSWLFRAENRYQKINAGMMLLFLFGFIGFIFVVFSQIVQSANSLSILDRSAIIGVAISLFGAFVTALAPSYTLKWGVNLKHLLPISKIKTVDKELFCVITGFTIALFFGSFTTGIIGVVTGETINGRDILVAISTGFFIIGTAPIMFRYANLMTNNLGINAISYSTPIFSLIWLGLFSLINVPHVDFLIIGTSAIIAANLLLNFEASISIAYKALIIALWACGTMVYLHDGFILPDYTATVTLAATMFILILSFRLDRLVRRATHEENIVLKLFRQIARFAKLGKLNKGDAENAEKALLAIDAHKTPATLHDAYNLLKRCLNTPTSPHGDATPLAEGNPREYNLAPLDELEADIDMLTHSKQQGMNFGELTALGFIGAILIFSLLFFQPLDTTGWGGFFIEMSSFILASVVLFLFFNILDLQRDRHRPILKEVEELKELKELKEDTDTPASSFSIVFRDATNRGFEQWVSVIVCSAIILAYGWLFWAKWLA